MMDKLSALLSKARQILSVLLASTKMSLDAEAQLIARCRQGDSAAWDKVFEEHYAATGRFIFQLASDFSREDVEEISQDVFLAVIKNINSFHGKSRLQTWIFRIAANKARDYRERQQAAKRGGGQTTLSLQAEDPETNLTLDPPSHLPGPDANLLNAERASQIGLALEQLGQPCREVIELRYFGDLSYEEISAELKLNPKTVSSRLSKCLDHLEKIAGAIFSGKKSTVFPV